MILEKIDISFKYLMEPRFFCIADYPGNPFEISDTEIIIISFKYPLSYFNDEKGRTFSNFKELRWWEYRSEEELPKYVKLERYPDARDLSKYPVVFKLIKPYPLKHPDILSIGQVFGTIEGGSDYEGRNQSTDDVDQYRSIEIKYYVPATEQEYLKHMKLCQTKI